MLKKTLLTVFGLVLACIVQSQTYTVNQQSQQVNINVPVIEKPVYIERYRTVYVEKPRKARKLEKPLLLLGYLWVYPEDLGNFKQVPIGVINSINAQTPFGHNNWRIPTPDELVVMEANAERIGLGDEIYLATDHRNGVLRLVCIDGEDLNLNNFCKIGNTLWAKSNFGTEREAEKGRPLTYQEALSKAPAGYRLPTEEEALELIYSGEARFGDMIYGKSIYLPYTGNGEQYNYKSDNYDNYDCGMYWIQGGNIIFFKRVRHRWGWSSSGPVYDFIDDEPEIRSAEESRCFVRYVKK